MSIETRADQRDWFLRELAALRAEGAAFAARYPRVAGALDLSGEGASDPDVERLVEAVAFLTAWVQRTLDRQLPRLASGLLAAPHPQLLAPTPSMAVATLPPDPVRAAAAGFVAPRGTRLTAAADMRALERAVLAARARGHATVELEHLLAELLTEEAGEAAGPLRAAEVEPAGVRAALGKALAGFAAAATRTPAPSAHLVETLKEAWSFASLEQGGGRVGPGGLSRAMLTAETPPRLAAASAPQLARVSRDRLDRELGRTPRPSPNGAPTIPCRPTRSTSPRRPGRAG